MEHNKEENMVQGIEYPVPIKKRIGRAGHSRQSTGDRPMFSAACQADKRILLLTCYYYMNLNLKRTMNERFLLKMERIETVRIQNITEKQEFHHHRMRNGYIEA
jgi:hypothetical protein